jgi:hypothetical protein
LFEIVRARRNRFAEAIQLECARFRQGSGIYFQIRQRLLQSDPTCVQIAITQVHNCSATWRETITVREFFRGQIVWDRDVEAFDLGGHAKAKPAL